MAASSLENCSGLTSGAHSLYGRSRVHRPLQRLVRSFAAVPGLRRASNEQRPWESHLETVCNAVPDHVDDVGSQVVAALGAVR